MKAVYVLCVCDADFRAPVFCVACKPLYCYTHTKAGGSVSVLSTVQRTSAGPAAAVAIVDSDKDLEGKLNDGKPTSRQL
jgi:hypothetical protein